MEITRVKKYLMLQTGLLLLALTLLPSFSLSSVFGMPDFNMTQILCKIGGLVLGVKGLLYFFNETKSQQKMLPMPFLISAGIGLLFGLLSLIPNGTPDWLDWLGCAALLVAFFLSTGAVAFKWNNAGTQGAYIILMATIVHFYNNVDNTTMTGFAAIVALVFYFIGLGSIKQALDEPGIAAISKLKLVAILGIIAAVLGWIPLVGAILGTILSIIAFIFELIAYNQLKKSDAIGVQGKAGAGQLFYSLIFILIAAAIGWIPVIGLIAPYLSIVAIVFVFMGWNKIVAGMETGISE